MRLEIKFSSQDKIILPFDYNHILQGFIYKRLSPVLARFYHEVGYLYGKRSFKLFTFSRLKGKLNVDRANSAFIFTPPVSFVLSSPKERLLEEFAQGLLKSPQFELSKNILFIEEISVHSTKKITPPIKIKMLSPVTVYSTLFTKDNKKKTYYFSPFEKEFEDALKNNLKKKYELIWNRPPGNDNFNITPLKVGKDSEKIVNYKGTIIKAWMGTYKLDGDPCLLQVAYECGLGSKNSQGFGCFEIL